MIIVWVLSKALNDKCVKVMQSLIKQKRNFTSSAVSKDALQKDKRNGHKNLNLNHSADFRCVKNDDTKGMCYGPVVS